MLTLLMGNQGATAKSAAAPFHNLKLTFIVPACQSMMLGGLCFCHDERRFF